VLVTLTVLFIAGVFEDLPEAVLGAIVIHAVWGMIDLGKLTRLWRANVPDFWLALGALLGVILIGILAGIAIGIALSLVLLIHRLDHPHGAILGRQPDGTRYVDVASHPDAQTVPGVLIYRLDAPLIFANADVVSDDLRTRVAAAESTVRTVVLDFEAVYEIDTEGTDMLVHLGGQLEREGTKLVIAQVHAALIEYMRRDGTLEHFGARRIAGSIDDAVKTALPA
jgi:MFS superfamily sulfate permease-like transporter